MSINQSLLPGLIKRNLPQTDVSLIFGYGSKVVRQESPDDETSLIDVIVVVNDPFKWHQENLQSNSAHYSFLRHLPSSLNKICRLQQLGAGVYFNPYTRIEDTSIKYGVISTDQLIEDLVYWNNLYIAGRLHKPVELIVDTCDKNDNLRSALKFNKESAIRAALLQSPETFDTTSLYQTITGLSYMGDLRMILGEDRNKVKNIVSKQMERFNQLYLPTLKHNQNFRESVLFNDTKHTFIQDMNPKIIMRNLKLLPSHVRRSICEIHGKEVRTVESDVVLSSVSRSLEYDKIVSRAISRIVFRSSTTQSLKGLLTAGLFKSLKYSRRKLMKSLRSA